ncbi:MAG: ComEA family DNA-binding protein [Thermoanaerobaculia bacterium]
MTHTILTLNPNPFHRALAAALVLLALAAATPAFAVPSGVVNVNTAETAQLELLPRIGPALAGRIIEFREDNGPFEAKEDLLLVRGIGERTLELLEDFVAIEGETTLAERVRPSELQSDDEQPADDEQR